MAARQAKRNKPGSGGTEEKQSRRNGFLKTHHA
jgi:hypothetical protein